MSCQNSPKNVYQNKQTNLGVPKTLGFEKTACYCFNMQIGQENSNFDSDPNIGGGSVFIVLYIINILS